MQGEISFSQNIGNIQICKKYTINLHECIRRRVVKTTFKINKWNVHLTSKNNQMWTMQDKVNFRWVDEIESNKYKKTLSIIMFPKGYCLYIGALSKWRRWKFYSMWGRVKARLTAKAEYSIFRFDNLHSVIHRIWWGGKCHGELMEISSNSK